MLDHIILTVSDVERSLKFYAAALKPLKIKMFIELFCLFVNRMNESCTCPHTVRCLSDSPKFGVLSAT